MVFRLVDGIMMNGLLLLSLSMVGLILLLVIVFIDWLVGLFLVSVVVVIWGLCRMVLMVFELISNVLK